MRPPSSLVALVAFLVPALVIGHAWAGQPSDQLRARVDRVLKVLDQSQLKPEDRRGALRKIVNEIFDVNETAKRALGHHWAARTPAEREEFVRLFGDLLERACFSKLELYGGEKVAYLGDSVDGDLATVRTKLVTREGTEIPVDYRMVLRGDHWVAYDVSISNVTLVANYRSQFNKIIQTASYQELVKQLRAKQDERDQKRMSRR